MTRACASCFTTWHKAYPAVPQGEQNYYIEEQGPVGNWCSAIRLFAQAATNAGPNLNRRTFVTAMSKITELPGQPTRPIWSFGPNKMYGPTQYQVVKIHNNVPPSSQCILKTNHKPQGTCWVVSVADTFEVRCPVMTPVHKDRYGPAVITSSTRQKTPKVFASTSTTTPMTQKSTGAA